MVPPNQTVKGRVVWAADSEVKAAGHTVLAALVHPIIRRAASVATSNLRRETPVLLRREDGTFLEDIVNLAFQEEVRDSAGLDGSGF
jgi:hypothetical protein